MPPPSLPDAKRLADEAEAFSASFASRIIEVLVVESHDLVEHAPCLHGRAFWVDFRRLSVGVHGLLSQSLLHVSVPHELKQLGVVVSPHAFTRCSNGFFNESVGNHFLYLLIGFFHVILQLSYKGRAFSKVTSLAPRKTLNKDGLIITKTDYSYA